MVLLPFISAFIFVTLSSFFLYASSFALSSVPFFSYRLTCLSMILLMDHWKEPLRFWMILPWRLMGSRLKLWPKGMFKSLNVWNGCFKCASVFNNISIDVEEFWKTWINMHRNSETLQRSHGVSMGLIMLLSLQEFLRQWRKLQHIWRLLYSVLLYWVFTTPPPSQSPLSTLFFLTS